MECINVKTAIIGSGIAGISASVNLLENNYKDFLLFEACNRIGGRIHTIDFEHSFLEMGAQV
jgi:predicted NAD/FAD-binding protein